MNLTYLDLTNQTKLTGTIPTEMYVTFPATLVRFSIDLGFCSSSLSDVGFTEVVYIG
jgi:hypothetical protein